MWIFKILHKLKLCKLVWIKLYDGTWELTFKGTKVPDGWMTYRFYFVQVGRLKLNRNGTTSLVCYITDWVDYE